MRRADRELVARLRQNLINLEGLASRLWFTQREVWIRALGGERAELLRKIQRDSSHEPLRQARVRSFVDYLTQLDQKKSGPSSNEES